MQIGAKLKQGRLQKELTQENVANILNVSRATISSWEVGRTYPDLESIVALSDLYSFSLDELLREDSEIVKNISKNSKIGKKLKYIITITFIISLFICIGAYIVKSACNGAPGKKLDTITDKMVSTLDEIIKDDRIYDENEYDKRIKELLKSKEFEGAKSIDIYLNPSTFNGTSKVKGATQLYLYENKDKEHTWGAINSSNLKTPTGNEIIYTIDFEERNFVLYGKPAITIHMVALIITIISGFTMIFIYLIYKKHR